MDHAAERPQALVIGLDPHRVAGAWDPTPVAEGIARATAQFAEEGINAQNCLIGLDGSDDVEAVVTTALREQPWDCVLVGGGIRTNEERLALFENIVNLVHQHAPGAAIAFNSTLDDVVDAVQRRLA